MKNTLVVYYSRTGNVKKLAQNIAEKRDADIYEIVDLINRNGIIGFIRSGYHGLRKKCTAIGPARIELKNYKTIIICGPVWAGNIASPVRSFLTQYSDDMAKAKIEYVIMRGDKNKKYTSVFKQMDRILGKVNESATSVQQGHID